MVRKSLYFSDTVVTVSADGLEDRITSVCFKNFDKLQSSNNTKLKEKSKNLLSKLLTKIKGIKQQNTVDVPFDAWKVAADDLISTNLVRKDNLTFKDHSYNGFIFSGDVSKEHFH